MGDVDNQVSVGVGDAGELDVGRALLVVQFGDFFCDSFVFLGRGGGSESVCGEKLFVDKELFEVVLGLGFYGGAGDVRLERRVEVCY